MGFVADTGSSSFVVQGDPSICANCSSDLGTYTPGASSIRFPNEFQVAYGSGQATNILFSDTVFFPCDAGDRLNKYEFGVVKTNNNLPNIFGLAYPSLLLPQGLTEPILPLFDQFLSTYPKSQDVIGITLCGDRPGSTIVFGGPDDRLSAEDRARMTWVPIEKDPNTGTFDYYNITALNVTVNGWKKNSNGSWAEDAGAKDVVLGDFGGAGSHGQPLTFVDTGSTLSSLPVKMNDEIIVLLKSVNQVRDANIDPAFFFSGGAESQAADISAETVALFPTFYINVKARAEGSNSGIAALAWPPEIYFKKNPPDPKSNRRLFSFRNGQGSYILGQAFLENWYVEHDRGTGQLGFFPNTNLCK